MYSSLSISVGSTGNEGGMSGDLSKAHFFKPRLPQMETTLNQCNTSILEAMITCEVPKNSLLLHFELYA